MFKFFKRKAANQNPAQNPVNSNLTNEPKETLQLEPGKQTTIFVAPCDGEVFPINQITDQVFANELVGKGIFINPSKNEIYSPIEGIIETIAETKHAIGIKHSTGLDILIHMGIDTVELKGEGFNIHVQQGAKVTTSTLLATFDLEKVKSLNKSISTPIIVTNDTLDNKKVKLINEGKVQQGQPIFEVI